MRIGMMTDVYKPHVSGITNYIELNKRHLEAAGHEVFVFTFGDEDYDDKEPNVIRSPGLPIIDTGYFLSLRYSAEAKKILTKIDVAHIHHPFLSGTLTIRYCLPRGIPLIFTNHTRYDLYAKAYMPYLPDGVSDTFLRAYFPNFCQSVDLVIAPSSGMKSVLQGVGVESHIEVVPNGVDIAPYQANIDPVDRKKFGFAKDDVVLVYAGRLGPEKNLPFLLRAFNGVAQVYSNVKLLIVGDGVEYENLIDRVQHMGIKSKVKFTGMVDYKDIPRLLSMADAFVTASVTEVHPLSVIEAMATGLPVLGIVSPGVSDTITDGQTGLIAGEEDLALFTAKMVKLVTDHGLRNQMGLAAQKDAEKYAIERTTGNMLGHYQRLVDESKGRKRNFRARFHQFVDHLRR